MKFTALVIPSGNATGVEVPERVMKALGTEARPAVSIMINGHTWRSRVARMRGQCLIGISAANRAASGIARGESVQVELRLDEELREVTLPDDLDAALTAAARAAFDRLPFGLKRKHVTMIGDAKSAETRARRIAKLLVVLES